MSGAEAGDGDLLGDREMGPPRALGLELGRTGLGWRDRSPGPPCRKAA